ncbi:unnamed protein product [Nippostrongylus brasiliensis]|uniref:Uncharacterized protein n=1 Tax=Nippostrongylus brasiliensis TaxID=27835 RepID=A0A0N4YHR9_NIPBR|nr:unnamed protein product [Nippostrongylus brasiliensis]
MRTAPTAAVPVLVESRGNDDVRKRGKNCDSGVNRRGTMIEDGEVGGGHGAGGGVEPVAISLLMENTV